MGRLTAARPSFFVRLQPYVGALVVTLGLIHLELAVLSERDLPPRALFTGLLIAGGGAGLVSRRARGARAAAFLGGAALVAGVVVWAGGGF